MGVARVAHSPVAVDQRQLTVFFTLLILAAVLSPSTLCAAGSVSRFEIATREELALRRSVDPLFVGDNAEEWPIVGQWLSALNTELGSVIDGSQIASAINTGLPIKGQPIGKDIDTLVQECATRLGVRKPDVIVRNDPQSRIYLAAAGERSVLVVTSGMVRLFEDHKSEFKFFVGRELGRLLCRHVELKRKSYGMLACLIAIDISAIPDEAQGVLPALSAGRFFEWCREAEYSADRAGLLCCGDPATAFSAMLRQQSGLAGKTKVSNPTEAPDFDVQQYLSEIKSLKSMPYVQLFRELQRGALDSPFLEDRIVMLKHWADQGRWKQIGLFDAEAEGRLLTITSIQAARISDKDAPQHFYVRLYRLPSNAKADLKFIGQTNAGLGSWKLKITEESWGSGEPLFGELWADNFAFDSLVGGFVIYPTVRQRKATASIEWDWADPSTETRVGVVDVTYLFSENP